MPVAVCYNMFLFTQQAEHNMSQDKPHNDYIRLTPNDLFQSIDWKYLREQKEWLCNQNTREAEGLLSLLDEVQDLAVSNEFATNEEVFGE